MRIALACGVIGLLAASPVLSQKAPEPAVHAAPAETASSAAPAAPDAKSDAAASADLYRPGLRVKDSVGAPLGVVRGTGQTPEGAAAVVVDIDGRPTSLAPAVLTLSPSGDHAQASMTKAEINRAVAERP